MATVLGGEFTLGTDKDPRSALRNAVWTLANDGVVRRGKSGEFWAVAHDDTLFPSPEPTEE